MKTYTPPRIFSLRKKFIPVACCLFFVMPFILKTRIAAQPPPASDSTPKKCFWNLTQPLFNDIVKVTGISYAKNTPNNNCKDVSYANDEPSNCSTIDDCFEGADVDVLIYDVYYPLHDYSAVKLPAIILGHPGGFSDCSVYLRH